MESRSNGKARSLSVALALFALTAGAAGRVMADPAQDFSDEAGIARWVVAVDQAEAQTAAAVKPKVVSVPVWQLAERIAVDHAKVDREFRDLAAGGTASIAVQSGVADLSKLSGEELEKAYVDREIKFHEAVLATLARDVIPNASSLPMRDRLVAFSDQLESELQEAKSVQYAAAFRKTAEEERAEISREISNDGP